MVEAMFGPAAVAAPRASLWTAVVRSQSGRLVLAPLGRWRCLPCVTLLPRECHATVSRLP